MSNLHRRSFLRTSLAAGTAFALTGRGMAAPSQQVNLAMIGVGGRGTGHTKSFARIPGVKITHIVDPDEGRARSAAKHAPGAKIHQDLRKALEDKEVDAVVISTCNHWHCLAAIWACQAGKDVYVEKPLGHNIHEQRVLIENAKKYNRIVQVGTQQRSDPVQAEIRSFLHEEKALGKIHYIHGNRYGVRPPVPKRPTPLSIPSGVDYDLWCGPAAKEDLFRTKLHYDWHWMWNTGNGEMGNWGVHILDDIRNAGLADMVGHPKRILAGGGRLLWNDAAETPNVHFVYYDTGSIPVIFDLSNMRRSPDVKMERRYLSSASGYTVHCEGGRYTGGRGGGAAYDKNNKRIKKFKGNGGGGHDKNFIDAVRARKQSILTSPLLQGHYSSNWCNMANIGYLVGNAYSKDEALSINKSKAAWAELLEKTDKHLQSHGSSLKDPGIHLSPVLEFDEKTEKFTGTKADAANALVARKNRVGFEFGT